MRYWSFILVLGIVFIGCAMMYDSDDSDAATVQGSGTQADPWTRWEGSAYEFWGAVVHEGTYYTRVGAYFNITDTGDPEPDKDYWIYSVTPSGTYGLDYANYGMSGTCTSTGTLSIQINYAYNVGDDEIESGVKTINLTILSSPTYTVTVSSAGGGTVSGGGTYNNGSTATITATPNTGYHFTNWSDGNTSNPRSFTVTGDVSLTAYFSINTYTVAWNNWDGTRLETDNDVAYGSTPSYNSATPTRPTTAQYTYTFSGWSPAISTVTENITYTAQFTSTLMTYTVTWLNWDGTHLETDTGISYGSTPTYDGATPTKPATSQYIYTFTGWSPAITTVTGNATYTAQFSYTYREYTDGEWTYGILDSGDAILLGYTGSGGIVQIPVTVGGMTVSNVGVALKDDESVIGIVIPSNIQSIVYDAFSGTSITEVLNLGELNITGTSYGLNGATIHTSIPGWFYISDVEYTDRVPDNSSVSRLIRAIPLLILIGVIVMIARNRVEDE